MISSQPILWLPASTWFQLLSRRLKRLTELHERLYQRREHPPNYGILTGLFAFLMQSLLFTPPESDPYVTESLNLLCFREVVERFGMFFLHDLDLTLNNCLPEILKMDDVGVYRSLKISTHRTKRVQLRHIQNDPQMDIDADEYPIGPTPTWRQLDSALDKQPWNILKQWQWSDELDELMKSESDPIAAAIRLFVTFTSQIWAVLHPAWKTNQELVRPKSLKEALGFWSLDQLHKRLTGYTVQPCNAGLRGDILGHRMLPFTERWKLYMEPDASHAQGARWEMLKRPYGLIGQYQNALKGFSPLDRDEFTTTLETLFSSSQCLPHTTQKGIWSIEDEKVVLLANPTYYKINAIKSGRTSKRKSTHLAKVAFDNVLIQLAGFSNEVARMAVGFKKLLGAKVLKDQRTKNKRRSDAAKGRRKAPTKTVVVEIPDSDIASSTISEHEDDSESDSLE